MNSALIVTKSVYLKELKFHWRPGVWPPDANEFGSESENVRFTNSNLGLNQWAAFCRPKCDLKFHWNRSGGSIYIANLICFSSILRQNLQRICFKRHVGVVTSVRRFSGRWASTQISGLRNKWWDMRLDFFDPCPQHRLIDGCTSMQAWRKLSVIWINLWQNGSYLAGPTHPSISSSRVHVFCAKFQTSLTYFTLVLP